MRLGSIRFLALRCTIWLALGTAPTFAQGADDCASATPISGTGLFLTGTGATTSPQQPSSCGIANHDVWYLWTPIVSSQYEVSTCGNTNGADTVLAVYPGPNCPTSGSQIACSDDDCGGAPWNIEAWVSINVVAGSNYLIQIGSQTSGGTFGGYFHIIDTAPAPCGPNTGPDVIVGDLHLIANYASQVVGGVGYDALSLGTYACNIGTDGLDWMGWNNHHPLVDNNLYKYSTVAGATRIEQLGMSWLRHTGTPVSDSVCCGACQALDTSHLGEHCADPETAAETGFQSYLGPRWQVNAAWGTFPFPPANPPYSGSVARRCQVKVSDLEPSSGSVHYFGEAQYVAQDDATAGNAYNNASYREISVTGSGSAWDFALATGSSTVRENPAIFAWQALDPSVQVANIDIAGDGRVVLAWKVTDLGGGTWHYEYALFNLNSDRSIQALSVPVGAGVSVSNVGFHDIAYHDGDGPGNVNFDGTDWPATQGGASIDWATSTFAQNPSANALRWGTLYNYRFDANVPPTSGTLTLTTFKIVGSVTATAEVPSPAPFSAYCFGDGTGPVACPCNNTGAPGHGCANSQNAAGALLTGAGSTTPDTLMLTSAGEPSGVFSILLQSDLDLSPPVVFGDGVRCIGGHLKRMYLATAPGGVVQFPPAGAPSISAQSALKGDPIVPGSTRSYQVYFRDSNPSFCPSPAGNGWNIGNAQRVIW